MPDERVIETEIDNELKAMLDELVELRGKKARHDNVFHEGAMSPSMKECPGCRELRVSQRYHELLSARGDIRIPTHKSKSRRDETLEHLKHRREVEEE